MKKHRYKISFLVTALIYIGFFLLLFDTDKKYLILSPSSTKDTMGLSFSQFVSKTTLPSTNIAPIQKEQLVEEKLQPKPEKKEQLVEEKLQPKPEKIEKKELLVTKKDLRDKAIIKKKIPRSHKKTIKKSKPFKKSKPSRKRQLSGGGSPHYSSRSRNDFLAHIRAKIEHAKSYPRIAYRRGIQGMVKVRFTILPNGQVGNIVLSGSKVFYASVRKAVKSAFPVDVKKVPLRLPITVNLLLRYRLH